MSDLGLHSTGLRGNKELSVRLLRLLPELLSQLCFRLSEEQLDHSLAMAMRMFNLPALRQDPGLRPRLDALFRRLFFSMPQEAILRRMPALLELPIRATAASGASPLPSWAEPFGYID